MYKMFNFLNKKLLVGFLVFAMVSNFLLPGFLVKKANAQFGGVVHLSPISVSALAAANAASRTAADIPSAAVKRGLIDTIIEVVWESLRVRLLDFVSQSIVDWVLGGPNGGRPQFALNLKVLARQTGDDALNAFLESTNSMGLCSPFSYQVRSSIVRSRELTPHTCTLDTVVGNIEAFYQDFTQGGWVGFSTMLDDRNNPYGSQFALQDEGLVKVITEIANQEKKVDQGGGYLPTESCAYGVDQGGIDTNGDGVVAPECYIRKITTPGGAIGSKLHAALNVDIEGILSAKEFTTYVAWIIDSIVFGLLDAGTQGLFGIGSGGGGPHGTPPTLPGMTYSCNQVLGVCSPRFDDEYPVDPAAGVYATSKECDDNCKTGDEEIGDFDTNSQACSAGVFVRGRPVADCELGECARCTGIGGASATDCCFVFCKHTKDAEWQVNQTPRNYSSGEVEPVCSFFGLSTPSTGCSCQATKNQYPFYNNPDVGKFKNCFDCGDSAARSGYLCKGATWCGNQEEPTPSVAPQVACCYGLDTDKDEIFECIEEAPDLCVKKNNDTTIIDCYRSSCSAEPKKEEGKCAYKGELISCQRLEPEPNSICLVSTVPVKAIPCDGIFYSN